MEAKLKVIVSFLIPAVLFMAVSVPLILRKIPRNCGYGFRTQKTLSTDAIWYKANQFGGTLIFFSGLATLIVCFWLYLNQNALSLDSVNLIGFASFIGPAAAAVVLALVYIKNL
ncbi:MAG: SdpI family protein [Candidatus Omnitrophica bacterium]|nr:SdpI family protein [Candidatus Omnitrophota bacterium]MDE2222603.1 SdpI family protein [Candidatus Omnitrophota bacterium]